MNRLNNDRALREDRPLAGFATTPQGMVALVLVGSLVAVLVLGLIVAWVLLSVLAAWLALNLFVRRRYGMERRRVRWALYGVLIANAVVVASLLLLTPASIHVERSSPSGQLGIDAEMSQPR